jgi:hypothetical protein
MKGRLTMRDYFCMLGLLVVVAWNVCGGTGCAANQKPAPIASDTYSIPAPTPQDADQAQQNMTDAMRIYWETQYARAKGWACKP